MRGGQVHGATNEFGGYVKDNRLITPPDDLAATILDHLGRDPHREYWDGFQQIPRKLSEGTPIKTFG